MMATTVLPVPTILNILSDSNSDDYYCDKSNDGLAPRAKKRRLDHLSWEEKIQRKKLKNRVAAQTSRDRKKAKQEQMEAAIQQLFNKNETLLAECEKLKQANERLQAENRELNQRLQCLTVPMPKPVCRVCIREWINRVPPSAERNGCIHSSGFGERPQGGTSESIAGLPSLPDLLEELDTDAVDLNALEQLTQTLLEDIARDLESAAQKAADQESTSNGKDLSGKMVGSPSKQLEPSGGKVLEKETTVEQDISEYLLLHHNYAKSKLKKSSTIPSRKVPANTRKLKTIKPKINNICVEHEITVNASHLPIQPENTNDVVYGTFDKDTNTITILVNDDSIPLNEVIISENATDAVQDTIIPTNETSNSLVLPKTCDGSLSPRSDLGYESLDSPLSNSDLDNWDASMTELFPSLF